MVVILDLLHSRHDDREAPCQVKHNAPLEESDIVLERAALATGHRISIGRDFPVAGHLAKRISTDPVRREGLCSAGHGPQRSCAALPAYYFESCAHQLSYYDPSTEGRDK
jgi:hypothetical protein